MSDPNEKHPAVPAIGEQVNYFDPKVLTRIGWSSGYGGRMDGPYLALVTNDNLGGGRVDLTVFLPGLPPFVVNRVAGPNTTRTTDEVYWDWKNAAQKARSYKAA